MRTALVLAGSKTVEPPDELTEVALCKDVYHCLPSELDDEDAERIHRHLTVLRQIERNPRGT